MAACFREKGARFFREGASPAGAGKGGRIGENRRKDAVFQGKYLTKGGQTYIYIIVSYQIIIFH